MGDQEQFIRAVLWNSFSSVYLDDIILPDRDTGVDATIYIEPFEST